MNLSPKTPVIAIRQVEHYFGEAEQRKQVLDNITLDIYSGEIVIMTGPSGSGKTTLLTLMGGLRSIQVGSLQFLGQEFHGATKEQGCTIVLVTHDNRILDVADRIVHMEDGRLGKAEITVH